MLYIVSFSYVALWATRLACVRCDGAESFMPTELRTKGISAESGMYAEIQPVLQTLTPRSYIQKQRR